MSMARHESISIRVEAMSTQPVRPAMRHSLGVSLSGCLMGITVAFSASALDDLGDDYYLSKPTTQQSQWFSSLASLTAGIWGIIFGRFVNRLGKKNSLVISALFYFLGYTLLAYSRTYTLLFVGRAITGVGLSITCIALSPYISEISPTKHRGKFASIMQIQVQIGILVINIFGVSYLKFRWNASITSAIALVNLFFIVIAPETPRWLLSKSRHREAEAVLEALMEEDPDLINDELQVLHRSRADISQDNDGTVSFFSKQNFKPLLIMSFIMIFQQLTAINAIIADSNRIFVKIGFDHVRLCSAAMSAGFLIFTFGSAALTDKAGRRLLLVVFAFLISFALALFGASGFLEKRLHLALLTVALGIYVFAFAMAWGSIPWVLCGELFTVENQGRAISIVSATNWTFNFLTVFSWSLLVDLIGANYLFLVYSGCMIIAAVFVGVMLPETKGLTLHQITDLFAPDSTGYTVAITHRWTPSLHEGQPINSLSSLSHRSGFGSIF